MLFLLLKEAVSLMSYFDMFSFKLQIVLTRYEKDILPLRFKNILKKVLPLMLLIKYGKFCDKQVVGVRYISLLGLEKKF